MENWIHTIEISRKLSCWTKTFYYLYVNDLLTLQLISAKAPLTIVLLGFVKTLWLLFVMSKVKK